MRHAQSAEDDNDGGVSEWMTFPLLLSRVKDETMVAQFTLEFPIAIAERILQHETWLSELTSHLTHEYFIEARYDIIPNGCMLASPEQGNSFQGTYHWFEGDAYVT